jgi:hypothetical protein
MDTTQTDRPEPSANLPKVPRRPLTKRQRALLRRAKDSNCKFGLGGLPRRLMKVKPVTLPKISIQSEGGGQ